MPHAIATEKTKKTKRQEKEEEKKIERKKKEREEANKKKTVVPTKRKQRRSQLMEIAAVNTEMKTMMTGWSVTPTINGIMSSVLILPI